MDKQGIWKYDITPLFRDGEAFSNVIKDLIKLITKEFDFVAGLDSLGYILGAAIANKLGKGFVPIRSKGKIPLTEDKILRKNFVDYSKKEKALEIRKDSVNEGDRILIVDDVLETGTQVNSTVELIEQLEGKVTQIIAVTIDSEKINKELVERYDCTALNLR